MNPIARIALVTLGLAAVVAPAARAQLASSPWPMFHAGVTHRGAIGAPSLATNAVRWTFVAGDSVWASAPALGADGTVYVADLSGSLYAIGPSGTPAWTFRARGPFQYSSPAVGADGTIYIGAMDSTFYAVRSNGTLKWQFRAGSTVRSSPAIAPDGTIYVGSGDNHLYAFNPDGSTKWSHITGANVRSSPAIGPDGTVYVASDDGFLYALLPSTGVTQWSFSLGSGPDLASPMVGPDTTVYIGTTGGLFYAVHPNGTFKWVYSTGHSMDSAPALQPNGNIAITVGSDVRSVRAADGTLAWRFVTSALMRTSVAVASDGTLYAGSDNDTLYALDSAGAPKWRLGTGGSVRSSPAIAADGAITFGSFDGRVRQLGPPLTAVLEGAATEPRLSRPWPNPARDGVSFTVRVPSAAPGSIEVVGVDGRVVRSLWRGTLPAAPMTMRWDGRDERGAPAAAGLYWILLRGAGSRDSRRVCVVR